MNRVLASLALAAALAACNKAQSVAAAPDAGAAQPAAPVPFGGKLTGDRVMGARGLAHPFDPWPAAEAKLEAQLGKPTQVKNGKTFMWAVAQGDDCYYVEVEKQSDNTVGMVGDPMKVSKGGPVVNYDECLTAAGVRKAAVEDPNAPGPPTDGKPIGVVALRDGASKGRSKWTGAKITVKGLYLSVTKTTVNGVESATVSLTAAKGDLKNTVSCTLADPKKAPDKLLQYAPIKATGDVEVSDMISLGGDRSVSVGLAKCAVAK
jgi:hypothetical protein